ncbi:MAG: DinB family protein [Bacteroidetes bacterium]|nr:DinB family protein [Bacteroidota bacterium]
MYRMISDFIEDWAYESDATLKLFRALTDQSLNQKVTPEGRSIGRLAWHITQSLPEMLNRTGLEIGMIDESSPVPSSVSIIISEYEKFSKRVSDEIQKNWNDKSLFDEVNMYGEMWTKRKVVAALIGHQTHHRAQITVLMRQAGLKVPGVYGPSKEEWSAIGMPAQE